MTKSQPEHSCLLGESQAIWLGVFAAAGATFDFANDRIQWRDRRFSSDEVRQLGCSFFSAIFFQIKNDAHLLIRRGSAAKQASSWRSSQPHLRCPGGWSSGGAAARGRAPRPPSRLPRSARPGRRAPQPPRRPAPPAAAATAAGSEDCGTGSPAQSSTRGAGRAARSTGPRSAGRARRRRAEGRGEGSDRGRARDEEEEGTPSIRRKSPWLARCGRKLETEGAPEVELW